MQEIRGPPEEIARTITAPGSCLAALPSNQVGSSACRAKSSARMPRNLVALFVLAVLVGCDDATDPAQGTDAGAPVASQDVLAAAEEETVDARPQKKGSASGANERVDIPAGSLVSGSTPGDLGRDPSFEPALVEVTLGPYQIDKLPHPNDPTRPPTTGVTRERAAALCGEAGGRLCTELEWEHACKGPEGQRYAGGDVWDETCAKAPQTCASGFGALAMGAAMREWTASNVLPIKEFLKNEGAAVRGAVGEAAGVDHRCAHRVSVDPNATGADLGFRCCYGAANEPHIASPSWVATMRKADMPADRLAKLLASNRHLAGVSEDIKYFREEAAIDTVLRRGESKAKGDAGAVPPNVKMTTGPIVWNPAPGEEILLVTGQSQKDSFIVAFHLLPGDRHRVAAAMVLKDELGPIVFAVNPFVRRKLEWSICWQCEAETGFITYRPDNRVVITQD
jgi:formylglycine-generating enzyme required for sulfatase activity